MRVLILAEHDNRDLSPATHASVTAACQLSSSIDVIVAGSDCQNAAEQAARIAGVKHVYVAAAPGYANNLAEPISEILLNLAESYDVLMAPATASGKNIMPRVAALLDVQQISDVVKIIDSDTFVHPIYAGNAMATVKSTDAKKVLTIRTTVFEDASTTDTPCPISTVDNVVVSDMSRFVECRVAESVRPQLTTANVIVAGGRGIGSDLAFSLISQLADSLDGAVGASRAAVDAGFIPNDAQVGQTGKIVAPNLYIAVGISGAIQHLAGMKDSKVIVAINKDREAPIFQVADYGLVADIFEAVPQLIESLDA